jgi:hypothetical protein
MRAWKSSMLSKASVRPRCSMRCGEAAAGLMMAPAGGEVAAQYGDAAFGQQRLASQPDHLRVPDRSGVQVVHEWPPSDGDGR